MASRVTIEIEDHVAQVRLDRPDKLNALDAPMFDALIDTGERLTADAAVRAVVLAGNGRAFSAGLDFASFMAMKPGDPGADLLAPVVGSPANRAQSAAHVWTALPVPVIAAVHGYCFGGGLQIALGADIRFVHPHAELSVMEMKWGLIPDMTGTQTLRHLVALDIAKELAYTARRLDGAEAVTLGLATHCVEDPIGAATELAREIAAKSPHAVRAAKALLSEAYTAEPSAGLRREEALQRTLLGTPNQAEAVKANMEKRSPRFADVE
jgi:enoyl-CoA hydratase/carnithine racemase